MYHVGMFYISYYIFDILEYSVGQPHFESCGLINGCHYTRNCASIKHSSYPYASESWTLLAFYTKSLESFHMKCQRHILGIRWYDRICNTETTESTELSSLMDLIIRRHNSLFGHVTRLRNDAPANQALQCQINISLGRLPDRTWQRPPGRPRSK